MQKRLPSQKTYFPRGVTSDDGGSTFPSFGVCKSINFVFTYYVKVVTDTGSYDKKVCVFFFLFMIDFHVRD